MSTLVDWSNWMNLSERQQKDLLQRYRDDVRDMVREADWKRVTAILNGDLRAPPSRGDEPRRRA